MEIIINFNPSYLKVLNDDFNRILQQGYATLQRISTVIALLNTQNIIFRQTFVLSHSIILASVTSKSPNSDIDLSFFVGFAKIFLSSFSQATRHKTNISLIRATVIVDGIPKNFVINLQARCCFTFDSKVWFHRCSLPCKLFGVHIIRKLLLRIFQVLCLECRVLWMNI